MLMLGCALVPHDPGGAAAAAESEARALFRGILADPANVPLNLRYARLMERDGELRKALATYERVVANHPENAAARAGLERITRLLASERTDFILGFAIQFESNPRLLDDRFGGTDDLAGILSLRVEDERTVAGTRLLSRLNVQGKVYSRFTEGNLAYVSADSGPILSLGPGWNARPLLGVEHARVEAGRLFTAVFGGVEVTREGREWIRGVEFLASYADFADRYPGRDGALVRVRPQLAWDGVLTRGDRLAFDPELAYNAAEGEDEQYRYLALGGTLSYLAPVGTALFGFARVYGGPDMGVERRWYQGREPGATRDRRDLRLVPGARLIGTEFLGGDVSMVLRYFYERNRSNEDDKDFDNHTLSLTVLWRF